MQHSVAWQCIIDQWDRQANRLIRAWVYRGIPKVADSRYVRGEDEPIGAAFDGSCLVGGRIGDDG